jgi:aspartyl-tRNA(Asn)/glutamyl-tRNA(Gln) amidotransferase subunit A
MSSLVSLNLAQLLQGLCAKTFSSYEVTQAYLQAMERGRHLNAYITELSESALQKARESDAFLAKGRGRKLEGIPLAIKDLFCTAGIRTTAASRMLGNFVPPYESTVTAKLLQAGAFFLGKTNLDEFAMGSSNMTSAFGPVKSPWRIPGSMVDLVPGGSSGGSAAAVSSGLAVAALGTDTGGSIRQPASFCGIVGLKPTYGRCSRRGIVAFASSFDQAGPMTRTVEDAALMLEVMAGHDPWEATSSQKPVPAYAQNLTGDVRGLKVGVPREYQVSGMAPEIQKLWEQGIQWFKEAGAEIVPVSLEMTGYALPVYYIVASAEASSNLSRYDGVRYGSRAPTDTLEQLYSRTRDEGFGTEVKRRILMGTYVLSHGSYDAYYIKAQKVRRLIFEDFEKVFQKVDVLLTPSTPTAAFPLGKEPADPVTMYLNDILTVPANAAGLPAISVPAALSSEQLPLGLQLIGRPFDEETLLNGAMVIEKAAAFPPLPFV